MDHDALVVSGTDQSRAIHETRRWYFIYAAIGGGRRGRLGEVDEERRGDLST